MLAARQSRHSRASAFSAASSASAQREKSCATGPGRGASARASPPPPDNAKANSFLRPPPASFPQMSTVGYHDELRDHDASGQVQRRALRLGLRDLLRHQRQHGPVRKVERQSQDRKTRNGSLPSASCKELFFSVPARAEPRHAIEDARVVRNRATTPVCGSTRSAVVAVPLARAARGWGRPPRSRAATGSHGTLTTESTGLANPLRPKITA